MIETSFAGPDSVELATGNKQGSIANTEYHFARKGDSWRLWHIPPCEPGETCFVEVNVTRSRGPVKWLVGIVTTCLALLLFGALVVLYSGKSGVLHGDILTLTFKSRMEGGDEVTDVEWEYTSLDTSAPPLTVPLELDYRAPQPPGVPVPKTPSKVEITKIPSVICEREPHLQFVHESIAPEFYKGHIPFPTTTKRPAKFKIVFQVSRAFAKDLSTNQNRWGASRLTDDSSWTSSSEWKTVKCVFVWSEDFKVGIPFFQTRRAPGDPLVTYTKEDKRLQVEDVPGAARKWTLTLSNVEYGSTVKLLWPLGN